MTGDRERLLRALLHDLRTPLNVVQAALQEMDVSEDDETYRGLAERSAKSCVFALGFVQRALDLLADGSFATERIPPNVLEGEVDRALAGISPGAPGVAVDGIADLFGPVRAWALALAALRILAKDEPLRCTVEASDRVRVERASSWAHLLEADPSDFASLRPGYAAWVLSALVERERFSFGAADAPTALRLSVEG